MSNEKETPSTVTKDAVRAGYISIMSIDKSADTAEGRANAYRQVAMDAIRGLSLVQPVLADHEKIMATLEKQVNGQ